MNKYTQRWLDAEILRYAWQYHMTINYSWNVSKDRAMKDVRIICRDIAKKLKTQCLHFGFYVKGRSFNAKPHVHVLLGLRHPDRDIFDFIVLGKDMTVSQGLAFYKTRTIKLKRIQAEPHLCNTCNYVTRKQGRAVEDFSSDARKLRRYLTRSQSALDGSYTF